MKLHITVDYDYKDEASLKFWLDTNKEISFIFSTISIDINKEKWINHDATLKDLKIDQVKFNLQNVYFYRRQFLADLENWVNEPHNCITFQNVNLNDYIKLISKCGREVIKGIFNKREE